VLGIWEASYHGHAWSADKCQTAIDAALGGESPTPLDELADELADDDMDMEPTVADGVDMYVRARWRVFWMPRQAKRAVRSHARETLTAM
jgi:hypothetical protein